MKPRPNYTWPPAVVMQGRWANTRPGTEREAGLQQQHMAHHGQRPPPLLLPMGCKAVLPGHACDTLTPKLIAPWASTQCMPGIPQAGLPGGKMCRQRCPAPEEPAVEGRRVGETSTGIEADAIHVFEGYFVDVRRFQYLQVSARRAVGIPRPSVVVGDRVGCATSPRSHRGAHAEECGGRSGTSDGILRGSNDINENPIEIPLSWAL